MSDDKLAPPTINSSDKAYTLAKMVVASTPYVGGTLTALFEHIIQPPLTRRLDAWRKLIGETIQKLEARVDNVENLSNNDEFVSAVMHASKIAVCTHQDEKLTALRNAVFNIAINQSTDDTLNHMFFEWIDSLSVLHFQILKLFQNPKPPPGIRSGSLSNVIEHNMPHLKANLEVFELVWKDLYSRNLVNTENINLMMTSHGLAEKRTTKIGEAFIQFISESESSSA